MSVANCRSSGNRDLKQTAPVLPSRVAIKRGTNRQRCAGTVLKAIPDVYRRMAVVGEVAAARSNLVELQQSARSSRSLTTVNSGIGVRWLDSHSLTM